MASFDFEKKWAELKEGIALVIDVCLGLETRKIERAEWATHYNTVYTWCTRPEEQKKEELYQNVSTFFDSVVAQQEEKLRVHPDGEVLLKEYLKTLENFASATSKIKNIFSYMHRYWIPSQQTNGEVRVRNIDIMSLVHWRERCYAKLKPRLLESILSLVNRERLGEQVDKTLLSSMVNSYIRLGVIEESPVHFYKAEFQDPFIAATKEFYKKESDDFLVQNSVSEYMKKAEIRINQETTNAQQYLHPSTEPELKRAIEESLIERHNEVLQNEFQAMLRDDRDEDMRRFFFLLSRIPDGLNNSSATMRTFLKEVGMGIVKEQATKLDTKAAVKNSIPLINALLNLHKKYSGIVKRCFSDHKLFSQAMDEAFTFFINKNVGVFSMAELLNFFVDHLLKGNEKLPEDQMEETLENVVRLFSYFDDKDVFYLAFRRGLSKRLLSRKINEDAEMLFISKLKIRCGDVYTKKLEGMFNDIKMSNERLPLFKEYLKETGQSVGIDMQVTVLNDLYWPLSKQTELVLGKELLPAVKAYEAYYHKNNEKRKLTWLYNHGTIQLAHNYSDKGRMKKVELIISAIQASVLLMFNTNDKLTFKHIQTELNLNEEMLKFSLAPLVYNKVKILNRHAAGGDKEEGEGEKETPADDEDGDKKKKRPSSKSKSSSADSELIDGNDTFSVAVMKKLPKTKITFPPGSTKMLKQESDTIVEKTQQDRIIKIELALVRVMKSRNVCAQNELISEASRQLMQFFRPDPRLMKKRIETLMERGFMRRDESDQKMIHYVA